MKTESKKDLRVYYLLLGCVLAVLSMVPFFIMGENSIITYHDQLDGEMITYILNAKHLFEGLDTYPELMNGIPSAGMMSPAPIFVLLFKVFSTFTAFMIMATFSRIAAFSSMFLLSEKATKKCWVAFLSAIAFMMIPFYPVYGLSVTGQAFVWYSLYVFADKESKKTERIISILLSIVYALTSSLALVGFAVISVSFLFGIILIIKNKKFNLFIITPFLLGIVYALLNMPLVKQILHIGYEFTSHKSELIFNPVGFLNTIKVLVMGEDTYTNCFQWIILFVAILFITTSYAFAKKKSEFKKENGALFTNIAFIVIVTVFVALYNSTPFVNLRNASSGMLHDFNFGRFSWMLPVAYFLLFSQSLSVFFESLSDRKVMKKVSIALCFAATLVLFSIAGFNNDVKPTVMRMIKGSSYRQITYAQFYSEDLFNEADKLIGKDKKDYRVICLGLHPACAAYNGYYCLDAYSNNYDVNYKHEFRNIIAGELNKSDYYTSYYDEWGNRCYAFLADYSYIKNDKYDNTVYDNLDINFEVAKSMGAEYVFSTAPISNSDELGITLLNDKPIESEDNWYNLYVYRIN